MAQRTSKGGVFHRGDFTVRYGEQGTFGAASNGKRVVVTTELKALYNFVSSVVPSKHKPKARRGVGSY